eukprot:g77178.t1
MNVQKVLNFIIRVRKRVHLEGSRIKVTKNLKNIKKCSKGGHQRNTCTTTQRLVNTAEQHKHNGISCQST